MNWDAIGAVGEVAGALAVVVTLVYLSRQLSATATDAGVGRTALVDAGYRDLRRLFVENAELWAKGNAGSDLTPAEQFAFDELVLARSDHSFFWFARENLAQDRFLPQVAVADMALFLHRFPAARPRWEADQAGFRRMWNRLGMDGSLGLEWHRRVVNAIEALGRMDESTQSSLVGTGLQGTEEEGLRPANRGDAAQRGVEPAAE